LPFSLYYTSRGRFLLSSLSSLLSFFLLLLFFALRSFTKIPPLADLHDLLPATHSNHSRVPKVTSYPLYIHTSTHRVFILVTQSSVIANQYPSLRV
jgi:hypothetical protein